MFKKLKEKLAEEVKSSPQRIQQFAQAAQAAVTSASSSISDITNNDLFSIGDNESSQNTNREQNKLQEVPLGQNIPHNSSNISLEHPFFTNDYQRQRRLSNSSFASDVSFRLPSYESPSMYHLQSDMDISASEAEDRFPNSSVNFERVSKDQLYAAYRRTQEKYTKYRNHYSELSRHYKLLEKENTKARSVLVETQDKALRRISELREQCSLEQSAKAHLEKALRDDINEKCKAIDALNSTIQHLKTDTNVNLNKNETNVDGAQLINLSNQNDAESNHSEMSAELVTLNNKIEKMEQLINKYKESLKTTKEKNAQLTTELQILSNELDTKNKDIDQLKGATQLLNDARKQIHELNETNEELQNQVNSFDFKKSKEITVLELDFQKAQEEILQLNKKIEVFNKREEEYAFSLAENKLSIHKELEAKETEIKSLKDSVSNRNKEIQSLNIVINDYKNRLSGSEEEFRKVSKCAQESSSLITKIEEKETYLKELTQKLTTMEQQKIKTDEDYKCLQLQLNQENAEKLALNDRILYLETRNTQLSQENTKKTSELCELEKIIETFKKNKIENTDSIVQQNFTLNEEINKWKTKYNDLQSEITEERDELVKLQSEIEKLLSNYETVQTHNVKTQNMLSESKTDNAILKKQIATYENKIELFKDSTNNLRKIISELSDETLHMKQFHDSQINTISKTLTLFKDFDNSELSNEQFQKDYDKLQNEFLALSTNNSVVLKDLEDAKQSLNIIKSNLIICEKELGDKSEEINNVQSSLQSIFQSLNVDLNIELHKQIEIALNKIQFLQMDSEERSNQNCIATEQITNLENDKQELLDNFKFLETKYILQSKSLENLKAENDKYEQIKIELNEQVRELSNENTAKTQHTNQLKINMAKLTDENISLKSISEHLKQKVNNLEIQISEITKLHKNLELEKDHLESINKVLERKPDIQNCECQTDLSDVNIDDIINEKERLSKKVNEFELMTINNESQIQSMKLEIINSNKKNVDQEQKIKDLEDFHTPLMSTITENNLTNAKIQDNQNDADLDVQEREENKRLKSEIEGLQAYLATVSKENSALNDKLREVIASSDNKPLQKNANIHEEQMEDQTVEDLLRENALLSEENLELKDQINSQSFVQDEQKTNKADKCEKLLESNRDLEFRINELEQINNSTNMNIKQLQEHNEKLRHNNQKLESRLDESLVSLRHLHALQENTELEYLKNVLYEYLTGSGSHSETLAKVLSAVVKFDDVQTQKILQKEKERQGLLRQLGLS